jgi:hypothetical protein
MIHLSSSSAEYQTGGKSIIPLPGNVVIVSMIHFRISSRPANRP